MGYEKKAQQYRRPIPAGIVTMTAFCVLDCGMAHYGNTPAGDWFTGCNAAENQLPHCRAGRDGGINISAAALAF